MRVRRGIAWRVALAFSCLEATTAAAFHPQHSAPAVRSPALLFAGPALPFGRARTRIDRAGSSQQRSPSAALVTTPGSGGGLPLTIRLDQTKRMASRGGDEGELLASGRSKGRDRRSQDARDGGQNDEDDRDGEDYTGVSSEFNALCQVGADPAWYKICHLDA